MHFTHCVKHGPHYMMEYNQITCIYCTEQQNNQQISGRWKKRWEETDREEGRESVMYLNQSFSWCSCLLLWSLRMKTWLSSHCWGAQWKSVTVPCKCCWGTSHCKSPCLFPSLDLPRASFSLDDYSCGSRDFSETMLMQMLAKAPAHTLVSPSTHTQWPQRWSRRQWEAGPRSTVSTGS